MLWRQYELSWEIALCRLFDIVCCLRDNFCAVWPNAILPLQDYFVVVVLLRPFGPFLRYFDPSLGYLRHVMPCDLWLSIKILSSYSCHCEPISYKK